MNTAKNENVEHRQAMNRLIREAMARRKPRTPQGTITFMPKRTKNA